MFLPTVLIPACASSSQVFLMMYCVYKLNKQDDNIQPWRIPFPIWNQSVVPCPVLTVASSPAYRFFRRQVRWSGKLIVHRLTWTTIQIQHQTITSPFENAFCSSLILPRQGGLVCCSSWGCKESDTTEWLNWTEYYLSSILLPWNVNPIMNFELIILVVKTRLTYIWILLRHY